MNEEEEEDEGQRIQTPECRFTTNPIPFVRRFQFDHGALTDVSRCNDVHSVKSSFLLPFHEIEDNERNSVVPMESKDLLAGRNVGRGYQEYR